MDLSGTRWPVLIKFKSDYAALWVMICFPIYNLFPTEETSQVSRYPVAISMAIVPTNYIPWSHQH